MYGILMYLILASQVKGEDSTMSFFITTDTVQYAQQTVQWFYSNVINYKNN